MGLTLNPGRQFEKRLEPVLSILVKLDDVAPPVDPSHHGQRVDNNDIHQLVAPRPFDSRILQAFKVALPAVPSFCMKHIFDPIESTTGCGRPGQAAYQGRQLSRQVCLAGFHSNPARGDVTGSCTSRESEPRSQGNHNVNFCWPRTKHFRLDTATSRHRHSACLAIASGALPTPRPR
jgi:hypothetical protein